MLSEKYPDRERAVLLKFGYSGWSLLRTVWGYGLSSGRTARGRGLKSGGTLGENLTSDAVAEKVITTLASVKRIPADKITLETNLQDLGIDSLDVFTLLFELENAFKISIPDDDVRSLRTVNDVVTGIKKIIAATPPDSTVGSPTPAD